MMMYSSPTILALSKQTRLLKKCAESGSDVFAELERLGYAPDSLRYRKPAEFIDTDGKYLCIDDVPDDDSQIPAISFFAGCGGLDLGFERAGFKTMAAFEIKDIFAATLRKNWPQLEVFGPPISSGDVREIEQTEQLLARVCGRGKPFEGVFLGGPPCQPFSIAANQRFAKWGDNFKRVGFSHSDLGNLLFNYIHCIQTFLPRAFLIENVPGLKDVDCGEQLKKATELLTSAGYKVATPKVLNAAHYGVPQQRLRVFIVGWRGKGSFEWPTQVIQEVSCWKALERGVDGLPNHDTRRHKAGSILRYMELAVGMRDQLGRVDRLDPNLPSKTVIAGGSGGGGRSHLHPNVPRTLSVREGARLQTFPDSFVFTGPTARQFTQVGNAVPPLLAYKLGESIRKGVFS